MANLNLMLSLEGRDQELKLRFGNMSFLEHLGKVSNGHDFMKVQITYEPGALYKSVFYFVWASLLDEEVRGLKRLSENKDKDPEDLQNMALEKITKRMISDIMDDLDFNQMMDIQYHAWAAMSGKSIEEIKKPIAQVTSNGATEKIL